VNAKSALDAGAQTTHTPENMHSRLPTAFCVAAFLLLAAGGCGRKPPPEPATLGIFVMDPLALPLSCECIAGFAQRDYSRLAKFLGNRLGLEPSLAFGTSLDSPAAASADLVIGKRSVIESESARMDIRLSLAAALTDNDGATMFRGLFIVRGDDPAVDLAGLAGRRLLFGPANCTEKHSAAIEALTTAGVTVPATARTVRATCTIAAIDVADGNADAAVISDYAAPLLPACGAIRTNELRVVGRTAPVPFIGAYVSGRCSRTRAARITTALFEAGREPTLRVALETRDGFVAP